MKTTKENILHYLKEIKPELEEYGIEKVALFGSFATNKQTVYSDIDIAIKKKSGFFQEHTAYDYFEIVSKLKGKILLALHSGELDVLSHFDKQDIKGGNCPLFTQRGF